MTAALLVVFSSWPPLYLIWRDPAPDPNDVTAAAFARVSGDRAFQRGVELRGDAAKARPAFAEAAAAYDAIRAKGFRSASLAFARASAHRLAGDLPTAVLALHDGLEADPSDRRLQAALEDARRAVAYPLRGDLATLCRPPPARTIGSRVAAWEGRLIAAGLWLGVCAAAARFAMTRRPGWLAAAGAFGVALGAFGWLWWEDAARPRGGWVVVRDPAVLRAGNAADFPARVEPELPAGVEARVLTRRGGWVQVELAGGTVGWLPEGAVIGPGAG